MEHRKVLTDDFGQTREIFTLKEHQDLITPKKAFSPFWNFLMSGMSKQNKNSNVIESALESGHRLDKRLSNVHTAFTFGKALKSS